MIADGSSFEMTLRPSAELIAVIRRFVTTVYDRMNLDRDLTGQIAMTAHELLENATKYSTDGEATIRMQVTGPVERPRVTIMTRNRVHAEDAARVSSCLEELTRLGDPQAYYLTLMRRAKRVTQTGGLGLGRIAAEGDMELSMSHRGDVLELQAVHRGPP